MEKTYRYTASGLDNVELVNLPACIDDAGEECITIKNVNQLHKAIATSIVGRPRGIAGRELRFLRTEMGMTQAEFAKVVNRDVQTVGRWERGETAIEPNAETIIRLLATARLGLDVTTDVAEVSGWCVTPAEAQTIIIDAHDPDDYRPLPMAA